MRTLDVPGITFGPNLQPDDLTRLTEGVIALVSGTDQRRGRIDWVGGKVTSSGDFATTGIDLAAPFGPVTGMTGRSISTTCSTDHRAGQTMTVESINPGIWSRTASSITSCCPTSWSRSSAANGRSWAGA
jgi:hypothetical protein